MQGNNMQKPQLSAYSFLLILFSKGKVKPLFWIKCPGAYTLM